MNTRITQLFILFFAGIITGSCKTSTPKPGKTKITTGKSKELIDQTITTGGGKIVINDVDGLRGLTIDIPANAYTESRDFHISYATIEKHDLGPGFNPVAPMIIVSNGGGYADSIMTMRIPIHISPEEFAMAFYYDDQTGKLEGIPLLASDENEVIIATRHFSHSSLNNKKSPGIAAQAINTDMDNEKVAKIVMTAVSKEKLNRPFDSEFRPGVDDCPNDNYGSTYAPNGYCLGQSLVNMWYFTEKKKKGWAPLYRIFDNDGKDLTPHFWKDDERAIKLSSVTQFDYTLTIIPRLLLMGLQGFAQKILTDQTTYYAFAYSIWLTKEPQFVDLPAGKEGHAMVVYRVEGNQMYIADPNYPGNTERRIVYDPDRKAFIPYLSGTTADAKNIQYSSIYYVAKSSIVRWPTIPDNWEKVEDGSIGEGKFPDFELVARNDAGDYIPFEDGFIIQGNRELTLDVRSPGFNGDFEVYDAAGGQFTDVDAATVIVPPGTRRVGVMITDMNGRWAGFKWIKIGKKQKASYYPGESGN